MSEQTLTASTVRTITVPPMANGQEHTLKMSLGKESVKEHQMGGTRNTKSGPQLITRNGGNTSMVVDPIQPLNNAL